MEIFSVLFTAVSSESRTVADMSPMPGKHLWDQRTKGWKGAMETGVQTKPLPTQGGGAREMRAIAWIESYTSSYFPLPALCHPQPGSRNDAPVPHLRDFFLFGDTGV
jgi:hypothetical protein